MKPTISVKDAPKRKRKKAINIGVGSPNLFLLDHWALALFEAFGEVPYHVGSSLFSKTWRDVDVRMILDDEQFDALFGPPNNGSKHHTRSLAFYSVMMTAISTWGQRITGLPIDFQIQRRSDVKQADWDLPRNPLGIYATNGPKPPFHKRRGGEDAA